MQGRFLRCEASSSTPRGPDRPEVPGGEGASGAQRRHDAGGPSGGGETSFVGRPISFDDERLLAMLQMALEYRQWVFSPLLERLRDEDGAEWFTATITRLCADAGVNLSEREDDSTIRSLRSLRELKRRCRATLKSADKGESSAPTPEEPGAQPPRRTELRGESPTRPPEDASPDSDASPLTRAEALAGYAASVALAELLHGVNISSRPWSEWQDVFEELSPCVPQPWSAHFERAAASKRL
ncbi:MAG TPA: hypothetical protein PKC43_02595 [Phycisphaerales bacterium]|nr:hypothetical protein [Phycisphaerales bacterium]HMP36315.1 hypothetical protein [Phycisphaerales bacterium]